MVLIRDLLRRDLDQKIVEVIQVDQTDEHAVYDEIREYVVTGRIREEYEKLLRAMAEARHDPDEAVGVWISGFFGSGKSSFAKNLGYVLANRPVLDTHAADLFKQQVNDPKISDLIDLLNATLPTEVVMFDVQKDRSQAGHGGLSISPFVYRVLLRELGYAEDVDLAELEIDLEGQGKLDEFIRRFNARYATNEAGVWERRGRKGAEVWNRVGAILHEMDPATYPTPESFARHLAESRVDVTPRLLVERTFDLMARRRPGKAITFIIDEVGQYVAYSQERLEDLRAVVELFGQESRNRVRARTIPGPAWFVVTSQERLDEVTSALGTNQRVLLATVRDRFKWEVDLSPADIREVATRRVLGKNAGGERHLARLFEGAQGALIAATRLERTRRQADLTQADFVSFYPYLPYYIELSIDIMSGIRLQPGAMRQLGGSNRTIISQVYQMLVNPRTDYADKSLGALVALDQIYELVEGQVGSTKQKDIADIQQRFEHDPEDGGWAARVAKAIALLEFVRDLPRTETNLAAMLVNEVGQAAPLPQVRAALARLEEAQFIRLTEDGYKLQTAQEKSWEEERRRFQADIRPADRIALQRELLGDVVTDQKLRAHRHRNKTFKVGLRVDGARVGDEGQIDLALLLADDAADRAAQQATATQDSRQPTHQNTLYWIATLDPEIDGMIAELYARRRMVGEYEQRRAQNQITAEESGSLANEKNDVARLQNRLKEKLDGMLKAGLWIFRGVGGDAAALGRTLPEMFGRFYDRAIPDLYPKLEMGTRPLRGSEAEEVLKAANLVGLSQVFYRAPEGLELITQEGSKWVPNKEAPIAKEVLDYLKHENAYGNKVTGKDLDNHFGGIGYGWDTDMLQVVLAVLLRAGAIEVTYQGRKFRNHQDPQSRAPFSGVQAFRNASFAPREAISLQTLTQAVSAFEDLTGEEVDVEETAIATAFKKLADDELRQLLPVIAVARAHNLPVLDALDDYRKTLDAIQSAPSDDCVRTLAGEKTSLKEMRKQAYRIGDATKDTNLAILQQARATMAQVWPALMARPEGVEHTAAAAELQDLLAAPGFYDQLDRIKKLTRTLGTAYAAVYQVQHEARYTAYAAALADLRDGWGTLPEETFGPVLAPLTARVCRDPGTDPPTGRADLSDGAVVCRRCHATLPEMESDLLAVDGRKAQVQKRIAELVPRPDPDPGDGRVIQFRVTEVIEEPLGSRDAVDNALTRLKTRLYELVDKGAQIVLE
jgi:hypothetical protein